MCISHTKYTIITYKAAESTENHLLEWVAFETGGSQVPFRVMNTLVFHCLYNSMFSG